MKTNRLQAATWWLAMTFAFAAGHRASASQQQGGPPVAITAPASAVVNQTLIAPTSHSADNLVGTVRVFTTKKKLSIAWSFNVAGSREFRTEEFDLDFWPTAAARISDSRLIAGDSFLLAGKRPASGKTVIERWDLAFAGLPSTSNETVVTKTVLFDERTTGKQVVRTLIAVNGVAGRAFALFEDSDNLFIVDASTGTLTLHMTPAQVPFLADTSLRMCTGGKLVEGSYCYVYQSDPLEPDARALLLLDSDGDGALDTTVAVPAGQWGALVDPLDWNERYNS